MAQFTNDSKLNAAIIAARRKGVTVEISNQEVEVYWTKHSSVSVLYSRLDKHHMAELLRDLGEAVEAIAHGL